jgi:hypothetical protein
MAYHGVNYATHERGRWQFERDGYIIDLLKGVMPNVPMGK